MLSEVLASQTALRQDIPNDPSPAQLAALTELANTILEPARVALGPIHIDSGYRSHILNAAVGGASDSAHQLGAAADCIPKACTKLQLIQWVIASGIPFDQVIAEFGSWIHIAVRGPGGEQRRQQLMIFKDGRGYQQFDPNDSRCQG